MRQYQTNKSHFVLFSVCLLHLTILLLKFLTIEKQSFTEHPFFNEDFIKQNKIKRDGGHRSYKKQGGTLTKTS